MYFELKENKPHGTKDDPFSTYHIENAGRSFQIPVHWHDEFEIIYVRSGFLTVSISGESYIGKTGEAFVDVYKRQVSGRRRAGRSKGRRQQNDRVQRVLLRDRGRSYAGGRRIFPADLQYDGGDQGACDKLYRCIGDDHAVLFVQPCVVLYAALGRKNDGHVFI